MENQGTPVVATMSHNTDIRSKVEKTYFTLHKTYLPFSTNLVLETMNFCWRGKPRWLWEHLAYFVSSKAHVHLLTRSPTKDAFQIESNIILHAPVLNRISALSFAVSKGLPTQWTHDLYWTHMTYLRTYISGAYHHLLLTHIKCWGLSQTSMI